MAFNPDDFQFERILPPEERKPILEWDALHRLMVVRTKQQGEYVYVASKLSETVNSNLHTHMPDEWSNDNDRIVTFAIFEDGEYILEREKLKFDFNTKQSKWQRYEYKELDLGQVKELFNIMKAALQVQQLDDEILRSKAILDVATAGEYLTAVDKEKQDKSKLLLRNSDWTQLPDAPQTFDGELALWNAYRQWIRDNVKGPAEFDDVLDFLIYDEEFRWPIDPFKYHQIDPEHTTEYLSVPAHFSFTIEGTGTFATELLVGNIGRAAAAEQARLADGVPVAKAIWDKVQQYKINDGLTGAIIENLNVGV